MAERPQMPERIETERLYLRPYRAGDGEWFHAMSLRNRAHLARYEAENVVLSVHSAEEAESLARELGADWAAGRCFFLGAFERGTEEFVGQIYVGPADWGLPEFEIGFFADCDHEGQGYVTEAVRAVLRCLFGRMGAHRVRLHCDDMNERSRRVAERCGLVLEGHIRESKRHPDGTLSGTLCFGMLKREHEAQGLVTIRRLRESDVGAAGRLIADTYAEFNLAFASAEERAVLLGPFRHARSPEAAHREAIARAVRSEMAFVAERDGEIVGILRGRKGRLASLFVRGDCHRQGIGRRLVERFEQESTGPGQGTIRVASTREAVPFYLALGYRRSTGVRPGWSFGGRGLRVQPMKKNLTER
jgi:ribosomal-protein-alanine N-acetyltransferase